MKHELKAIRFMDDLTDGIILICFLVMGLIGSYAAYDSYMIYAAAADDAILKFKPNYGSRADEAEIPEDMVAWLSIEDTRIDYPIMQGQDNLEYLNKDPFGKYSLSGSIFLDSRNSPNFSDPYSMVYGHHMDQGLMFGALDEYLKLGYLENHKNGVLTVGKQEYDVVLFAVLETTAMQKAVFAPTEHDDEIKGYIKANALYLNESDWTGDDKPLIALSTCKFPDTADRTVVIGVILR